MMTGYQLVYACSGVQQCKQLAK